MSHQAPWVGSWAVPQWVFREVWAKISTRATVGYAAQTVASEGIELSRNLSD